MRLAQVPELLEVGETAMAHGKVQREDQSRLGLQEDELVRLHAGKIGVQAGGGKELPQPIAREA